MGYEKKKILCLILFLVIFPVLVNYIPAISNYLEVMIFAGIFCLVTIGLSLLMGYAGQISLGHAAFLGIGAYSSGILTTKFGLSPWLGILAGVALSSAIAVVVGIPSLKLKGHYLAMATLGFGEIVFIVFNEEVDLTGGPSGFADIPYLHIGSFEFTSELTYYILVWSVVLIGLFFALNLIHSRVGRAWKAIHGNELAAEAMGVPTSKYKLKIFVLSSIYASIAGSLYTHYICFLNPSSFDLFWSIKFVMMVIVGGMNSVWGAIIGTVLLTYLGNEWLTAFKHFDVLVYGFILLLITMFLPGGIVSLPEILKSKRTITR
ncbi:MAG: branched-chain amino acid ABC transporter permease [Deltaproteobacteria bacterium]|nr:MAG: branched-chain amino acid ABC transporter permease [Deltaproteobacteria bacterium]